MTVVVIGAGANGLSAAAHLASAGREVVVLEARRVTGGLAAPQEFHDGYRTAGVLHDTTLIRPHVVSSLALERHGLELREHPPTRLALGGEEPVEVGGDHGEAHAAMMALLDRLRPALTELIDRPPVDLVRVEETPWLELLARALRVRRIGRDGLFELMRIAPMCIDDFLREHLEDEPLMAALAMPAVLGTFAGPRSPGTVTNLLYVHAMSGPGVAGGAPAFVDALRRAAEAAGAEVRTEAVVERIDIAGGRVTGVTLQGGERIEARQVAASCDPRTALLDLVHPMHLGATLQSHLSNWRCRGTTAHLALALSSDPQLGAEHVTVASSLDEIERAFDPVKYGELPRRPVLDVCVPSAGDAALCPEGHAVLSVLVSFVPYAPKGGWTEEARATLEERVLARLEEHIEGLRDRLAGSRLWTPADIESELRSSGGHIHHGEHAIDQLLVRPVPGCATYRTPIEGLYLCGAGTHPSGGLHGGNGALAARAMLEG